MFHGLHSLSPDDYKFRSLCQNEINLLQIISNESNQTQLTNDNNNNNNNSIYNNNQSQMHHHHQQQQQHSNKDSFDNKSGLILDTDSGISSSVARPRNKSTASTTSTTSQQSDSTSFIFLFLFLFFLIFFFYCFIFTRFCLCDCTQSIFTYRLLCFYGCCSKILLVFFFVCGLQVATWTLGGFAIYVCI